ncbi:MAG: hypothetical protein AAF215_20930 [Cyanobacteria bacterium P01_A01_bin.123]
MPADLALVTTFPSSPVHTFAEMRSPLNSALKSRCTTQSLSLKRIILS